MASGLGAAYLDTFDSNMIGNGILPALLHQDPRYFRMGHGSVTHRLLYAIAAAVICKHDNTGKWEPNYSNVLGNIASRGDLQPLLSEQQLRRWPDHLQRHDCDRRGSVWSHLPGVLARRFTEVVPQGSYPRQGRRRPARGAGNGSSTAQPVKPHRQRPA